MMWTKGILLIAFGLSISWCSDAQISDGLAFHFPLDHTFQSVNGASTNLNVSGNVSFVEGAIGSGLLFGTDSSEGEAIISPIIKPDWGEFSISLWIKANRNTALPNVDKSIFEARYDSRLPSYSLTQSRNTSPDSIDLKFTIQDYSNGTSHFIDAPIDTNWNHILLSAKTSDSMLLFINGRQINQLSITIQQFFFVNEFVLGNNQGVFSCPNGTIIDDVKVFRRQLDRNEPQKLVSTHNKAPGVKRILYTNPISKRESLSIELAHGGTYIVSVTAWNGQCKKFEVYNDTDQIELDLSNFPNGLSIISVYDKDRQHVYRDKLLIVD